MSYNPIRGQATCVEEPVVIDLSHCSMTKKEWLERNPQETREILVNNDINQEKTNFSNSKQNNTQSRKKNVQLQQSKSFPIKLQVANTKSKKQQQTIETQYQKPLERQPMIASLPQYASNKIKDKALCSFFFLSYQSQEQMLGQVQTFLDQHKLKHLNAQQILKNSINYFNNIARLQIQTDDEQNLIISLPLFYNNEIHFDIVKMIFIRKHACIDPRYHMSNRYQLVQRIYIEDKQRIDSFYIYLANNEQKLSGVRLFYDPQEMMFLANAFDQNFMPFRSNVLYKFVQNEIVEYNTVSPFVDLANQNTGLTQTGVFNVQIKYRDITIVSDCIHIKKDGKPMLQKRIYNKTLYNDEVQVKIPEIKLFKDIIIRQQHRQLEPIDIQQKLYGVVHADVAKRNYRSQGPPIQTVGRLPNYEYDISLGYTEQYKQRDSMEQSEEYSYVTDYDQIDDSRLSYNKKNGGKKSQENQVLQQPNVPCTLEIHRKTNIADEDFEATVCLFVEMFNPQFLVISQFDKGYYDISGGCNESLQFDKQGENEYRISLRFALDQIGSFPLLLIYSAENSIIIPLSEIVIQENNEYHQICYEITNNMMHIPCCVVNPISSIFQYSTISSKGMFMIFSPDNSKNDIELENEYIQYVEPINISIPNHTLTIPFQSIAQRTQNMQLCNILRPQVFINQDALILIKQYDYQQMFNYDYRSSIAVIYMGQGMIINFEDDLAKQAFKLLHLRIKGVLYQNRYQSTEYHRILNEKHRPFDKSVFYKIPEYNIVNYLGGNNLYVSDQIPYKLNGNYLQSVVYGTYKGKVGCYQYLKNKPNLGGQLAFMQVMMRSCDQQKDQQIEISQELIPENIQEIEMIVGQQQKKKHIIDVNISTIIGIQPFTLKGEWVSGQFILHKNMIKIKCNDSNISKRISGKFSKDKIKYLPYNEQMATLIYGYNQITVRFKNNFDYSIISLFFEK